MRMHHYAVGNVFAQVIFLGKSPDDSSLEETSPTADLWEVCDLLAHHPVSSSSANSDILISGGRVHAARTAIRVGSFLTVWVADHHHCLEGSSDGKTGWAPSLVLTVLSETAVKDASSVVKRGQTKAMAAAAVRLC